MELIPPHLTLEILSTPSWTLIQTKKSILINEKKKKKEETN